MRRNQHHHSKSYACITLSTYDTLNILLRVR